MRAGSVMSNALRLGGPVRDEICDFVQRVSGQNQTRPDPLVGLVTLTGLV